MKQVRGTRRNTPMQKEFMMIVLDLEGDERNGILSPNPSINIVKTIIELKILNVLNSKYESKRMTKRTRKKSPTKYWRNWGPVNLQKSLIR